MNNYRLWTLPLISAMGMKDGSEKIFGARYNILPPSGNVASTPKLW
jgi:hypothetical protein